MFWKIYFWVLVVLLTAGFISDDVTGLWDIVDVPMSLFSLVGLFSYAYKKYIFNKIFWKIFLPIVGIWDLVYNIVLSTEQVEEPIEYVFLFIALLLIIAPLYVALYRYAFLFLEGKEDLIKKEDQAIDQYKDIALPTITRRYLSTFIDGILVLSFFLIISFLFQQDSSGIKFVRVTLILSIFFIYEPLCTSKFCTLGQKLTGIRIRQFHSHQKISLLSAYGRILVKLFLGIISFFTIPFSKGKRGIHDFAASSIVIFAHQDEYYAEQG